MTTWFMDNGDLPFELFVLDPIGRAFAFDDTILPPVTQAARRTLVRNNVSNTIRRALESEGLSGLPPGNLLDILPLANSRWRPV